MLLNASLCGTFALYILSFQVRCLCFSLIQPACLAKFLELDLLGHRYTQPYLSAPFQITCHCLLSEGSGWSEVRCAASLHWKQVDKALLPLTVNSGKILAEQRSASIGNWHFGDPGHFLLQRLVYWHLLAGWLPAPSLAPHQLGLWLYWMPVVFLAFHTCEPLGPTVLGRDLEPVSFSHWKMRSMVDA